MLRDQDSSGYGNREIMHVSLKETIAKNAHVEFGSWREIYIGGQLFHEG